MSLRMRLLAALLVTGMMLLAAGCASGSARTRLMDACVDRAEWLYRLDGLAWNADQDAVLARFGTSAERAEELPLSDYETESGIRLFSVPVSFDEPRTDAELQLKFQDEGLVSGTYIIESESLDDIVQFSGILKDQILRFNPDLEKAGIIGLLNADTFEEAQARSAILSGKGIIQQSQDREGNRIGLSVPVPKTDFLFRIIVEVKAPLQASP